MHGSAFACLLSSYVACQGLLVDWSCMRYVRHTMLHVSLSSAKREQKLFIVDGMSLTNIVNNNGPNTDPWGTPLVTWVHGDNLLQPFVFSQFEML